MRATKMERKSKIYRKLLERAKETRAKGNWRFDLDMKNGDELTVYLEGMPITRTYKTKDCAVLTDSEEVLHFATLADIASYINERY